MKKTKIKFKKSSKSKNKFYIHISLILILIFSSFMGFAYYTNAFKWLNEQTNSYVDGDGQKRLSEDFVVDGCGFETMLDTVTGLCWDKNMNRNGSNMNWTDAVSYCSGLSHPSLKNDWYLPTRNELMTLIDEIGSSGTTCSTLGSFGFTNCQDNYYWSKTTYGGSTGYAWIVGFGNGNGYADAKTNSRYVVCVRRD